MTKYTGQLKD